MVEKGFAVLILILLSSGCLIHSTGDTLHVVSVGEQNAVYHFGDRVVINVSIYSPDAIKNITVKLSGLKNKLGQSKIHKSKNVDLEEGNNIISRVLLHKCHCYAKWRGDCRRLEHSQAGGVTHHIYRKSPL